MKVKPLSPEEQAFVDERKALSGGRPLSFVDKETPNGLVSAPDPAQHTDLWLARLGAATGARHERAAVALADQLRSVVSQSYPYPSSAIESALALMLDIAPTDGLEGMLATQMVTVHTVAMDMLDR